MLSLLQRNLKPAFGSDSEYCVNLAEEGVPAEGFAVQWSTEYKPWKGIRAGGSTG